MRDFDIKGKKYFFPEDQIKKYEINCVKAIDYNILANSAYDFIKFFLGVGGVISNDYINTTAVAAANNGEYNVDKISSSEDEDSANEEKDCESDNSIDNIEFISKNVKYRSVVAENFYTGALVDKIYSLSYNILDTCLEGKLGLLVLGTKDIFV